MKTRRSVPSWVPTLFFVMGNLLIIGASAQLIRLGYIPLPGLIAAFFWGETWVFWGITDLLGLPWRLKRSVREAPWRKEYQRRIGPIQIITGGLIMPASLLELMPAFLLSLLVTVAGGLAAYNIRCQYPGSW